MSDKTKIFHDIRNCIGSLQTFLDVVDTSADPRLNKFHQGCKESLNRLRELLKKLEES